MKAGNYTRHAAARAQQRCVSGLAVDLVVRFGKRMRHDGADVFCVDKKARKQIRAYAGQAFYAAVEDLLGIYVVVGEHGQVVTVAHRTTRLKNS